MWKDLKKLWKSDNLLDQAWEQSYEMLDIDGEMFLETIRILRETDKNKIGQEIRKKDKIVNKFERQVRRKVLTHLSVQGPIEMPAGLVLATIIIDIERIGDYTKNIAEIASQLKEKLIAGIFEEKLKKVEDAVKDNFKRTRICVKSCDVESALKLLDDYKWVNGVCDNSLNRLVKGADKKLSRGIVASLALYFRYLKRINSHLRNITSSVVNPFDRIGYKYKEK
jgi:phosphate transport system protein